MPSDTPALDRERPTHEPCGREMNPSMFDNRAWPPWWRSRHIWLCVRCSMWEPDDWDPSDTKGMVPRG